MRGGVPRIVEKRLPPCSAMVSVNGWSPPSPGMRLSSINVSLRHKLLGCFRFCHFHTLASYAFIVTYAKRLANPIAY
jgi:hypothetical protein